jgi:hypothetical protein
MIRPPLEVADLVRAAGTEFLERNRRWIRWPHIKVLLAIALSHRRTRRSYRSVHPLRTSRHHLV